MIKTRKQELENTKNIKNIGHILMSVLHKNRPLDVTQHVTKQEPHVKGGVKYH